MTPRGGPRKNAGRKALSSKEPTALYVIKVPISIRNALRGKTKAVRAALEKIARTVQGQ